MCPIKIRPLPFAQLEYMPTTKPVPSYWLAVFGNKCPRCRKGSMFVQKSPYAFGSILKMNDHCATCGQPMEIEPGFYYGTAYVSYALTVALSIATFVAWWVLIGFSLQDGDYRILYWGIVNALLLIVLQPVLMRFSRSLWLSWFVKYDPDWSSRPISPDVLSRINKDQAGNW